MVDINRYTFNFEEIVTALIKQLNINTGLWTLNVNFRFQANNVRDEKDSKAKAGTGATCEAELRAPWPGALSSQHGQQHRRPT
jgi:hypothetical protein